MKKSLKSTMQFDENGGGRGNGSGVDGASGKVNSEGECVSPPVVSDLIWRWKNSRKEVCEKRDKKEKHYWVR